MRILFATFVAVLFACPAFAGGLGSTVNISTTTSEVYSDRITEVELLGVGTHVFSDPYTAPELSQQSAALATALTALGLPMGTTATAQGTSPIDTDDVSDEVVMSNYNPNDNPDYVVGDPDNYLTWIAVGPEDVNVFVTHTTTHYTFHRMTAELDSPCEAGSYSANGQEPCSPCPQGYAQPSTGATACTPCAPGTFASTMGQTICSSCGPGTFELDSGSAVCDACPGGQASPCNDNGVCSDGPTGNGTCTCNVGYTGTACENGPPTTTTTTSTTSTTLPSGACAEVPEAGCVVASVAGLQIQAGADPAKNKLKWKLGGGSLPVDYASLGDPAASTSWTLCIYDSSAAVPFLVGSLTVGPSAPWTGKDPKGWKYKDKTAGQDGVAGVSLKTGVAGKSKAQLKAGGSGLPVPSAFDTTKFFDQGPAVTVQLVKDGGPGGELCWTSEFGEADTKLNIPGKFKATAK
jgi:hypothetical protein